MPAGLDVACAHHEPLRESYMFLLSVMLSAPGSGVGQSLAFGGSHATQEGEVQTARC